MVNGQEKQRAESDMELFLKYQASKDTNIRNEIVSGIYIWQKFCPRNLSTAVWIMMISIRLLALH